MNGDKIDSLYDSMFDKIIEAGFEFEPAPTGAGRWHFLLDDENGKEEVADGRLNSIIIT